MDTSTSLLLGVCFLVISASYLAVNKSQRKIVLERLHFHRRRTSGAHTPPQSSSPRRKGPEVGSSPDYKDVFPPSRRCALADIDTNLPLLLGKRVDELLCSPPGWKDASVPLRTPAEDLDLPAYTCTGFSIEEIKLLGDFPDYASLAGIPLPQPYPQFDINTALPRPYRPWRWAYHQTMCMAKYLTLWVDALQLIRETALTKMEPDWWLELEKTYSKRIKQRQELFSIHGSSVLDALPGSRLACKELMEMCVQFLCARYPHYFRLEKENMVLHNDIFNTDTDLENTPPLHVLLDNVPEDFAIMLRNPETGYYHLRAGVICSALGWNLGTKMGLRLDEIHAPIPDYKEKMQFSMDRYFAKQPCEKPIQRGSWGLEVDEPLFMPPGDPHEKYRELQSPDIDLSRCNLRIDWQTLRRLPLSGAVVFNFKALFTPVEYFRDEAYIPSLLLKVIREGNRSILEYKNTWHIEHVVLPALEAYEREQIEKGIIPANWEPHTLDESPWYPGWEEKWHRDQGF